MSRSHVNRCEWESEWIHSIHLESWACRASDTWCDMLTSLHSSSFNWYHLKSIQSHMKVEYNVHIVIIFIKLNSLLHQFSLIVLGVVIWLLSCLSLTPCTFYSLPLSWSFKSTIPIWKIFTQHRSSMRSRVWNLSKVHMFDNNFMLNIILFMKLVMHSNKWNDTRLRRSQNYRTL